jgi:hypothetical protein
MVQSEESMVILAANIPAMQHDTIGKANSLGVNLVTGIIRIITNMHAESTDPLRGLQSSKKASGST